MEPEFWQQRWAAKQIGFHQQEINTHLQEFWGQLRLPSGSPVFVPLCGKSRDMLWLRSRGHQVLGIEISRLAVAQFFDDNQLSATVTRWCGFERWSSDGLSILCGDFFSLGAEHLSDCPGVYDRASLIALPEAMRPRYALHLASILPAAAATLLVTMEYPQHQMKGPPFSVLEAEVHRLYAGNFQISRLFSADILAENRRFQQRGLTELSEQVYLLAPVGH